MKRRLMLSALPAWTIAAGARADEAAVPRKYVVMSLVGDQLTYVEARQATGSNVTANTHREIPMPGTPLDTLALQAMAGALGEASLAGTSFLKGARPEHFSGHDDWFDGKTVKLPDGLKSAIAGEHADFLLLLTKQRGDAQILDDVDGEVYGHGKLSGLGFYVDSSQRTRSHVVKTYGFSAPYVYARLSLVDLATMRVLREQPIEATRLEPVDDPHAGDLQAVLVASVRTATGKALAPA